MRHLLTFCLLCGMATASLAQQPPYGTCNPAAGSTANISKIATQHYGPKADPNDVIPVETSSVKVAYPKGHPKRTNQFPDDYDYLQNKIEALPDGTTKKLYFVAGKYRIRKSLLLKSDMEIVGQQGAILSGSEEVNGGWSPVPGSPSVYAKTKSISAKNIKDFKCLGGDSICERPNDLFLDGRWLTEQVNLSAVKSNSGTWMIDEGANPTRLVVHLPDTATASDLNSKMELSLTDRAFSNDTFKDRVNRRTTVLKKVVVKNLTFEMFTTNAFATGPDWKVFNCHFRNNHISGLQITNAGIVHVEQCRMEYNGSMGLGGQLKGATIRSNELAFNNQAGYDPLWHAGGMKITRSTNTTISDNFVHDNKAPGIWIDIFCDVVEVSDNYLRDNSIGIYYEISKNGIIKNNFLDRSGNNGIYIVSSPNVLVENNTVRYTMNGIIARQDHRGYKGSCIGSNPDADTVCRKQIRNITVRKNLIVLDNVNAVATGVRVEPYNSPDWRSFKPERFYENKGYNFNFSDNKYQYVTNGTDLRSETAFNWGWGTPSPYDPEWEEKGGKLKYKDTKGTRVISWTDWQALGLDKGSCLDVPKTTSLWLEAECGTIGNIWESKTDDAASNGKYVMYPTGKASTGAPSVNPADQVTFTVNVSQADSYFLLARIRAVDDARNSFWFKIDNRSWIEWYEGITVGNSFAWNLAPGGALPLSAGNHTITFAYREGGTQLDKLVLSTSSTLPSDKGVAVTACTPPSLVVTANAGADQTVALGKASVELYGIGKGPNPFRAYLWEKVSGPSVTMSKANTANVTLTNLQVGSYTFKFTATDSEGNSGSDEVKVTVTGGTPSQPVVTANAGADQTVALGRASVELYGIGKGPNPFRAYLWEKVSGPNLTLTIRGANATLTNLQVGSYEFKFTATDSEGNSGSDNVKVTVTSSSARTADSSSKPTVERTPDALTSVLVYPNPVDGSLKVSLGTKQPASLSLSDLSGRMLFHQRVVPSSTGEITISTDEFPEGMYLLRIEHQDQVQLTKLLIKH